MSEILTGAQIAEAHWRKCYAGPELYEALLELRRDPHRAENLARADAALAKALGPTPPEVK